MNNDKIILNYNDSLLHESDLSLLERNNWLNDRLIGFFSEYFEKNLFKDNVLNNNFGFVDPSTVQLLKLCDNLEEAKICFLDPLELSQKSIIFFPLNNNKELFKAGGSHWSLLVVNKKEKSLIHYDSLSNTNFNEARLFYDKYKSYLQLNKFQSYENFPQQTNSSDCGVYVIG